MAKNWHKYMLDIISPAISMEADMILFCHGIGYRHGNVQLPV